MPRILPFEIHAHRYEKWFERHRWVYRAELDAVKRLLPSRGRGLEVGVGTGRFAAPLGIKWGVDPAAAMRAVAARRGIRALDGVAEDLPFADGSFAFVLMVTTICFVDDIRACFREAARVLGDNGVLIVGFVDRSSSLGKMYEMRKQENVFYREATFLSVSEVVSNMREAGFCDFDFVQTVFRELSEVRQTEPVKRGFGRGAFVVVRARRRRYGCCTG